jgi:serine protease Do
MKKTMAIGITFLAASLWAPSASAQAPARARSAASFTSGQSFLGIGTRDIDEERAKALKLTTVRGSEVMSVIENSAAAKAGIKEGDVVLDFNGQPVEGKDQLARMIRETPIGRQVKIGLWRNGAAQTVTATLEAGKGPVAYSDGAWGVPELRIPEMPPIEIPKYQMLSQNSILGITGESIGSQDQLADFFGVTEGVLVKSVRQSSAADKAGLKAGDVIIKVEDTAVRTANGITNAIRAARSKTVNLTVVRNKREMPITVTIETLLPGMKAYTVRPGKVGWPVVLEFFGKDRVI